MSFHVVPHLPRFIVMVARYFIWVKVKWAIWLIIFVTWFFVFISNQGIKCIMPKSETLQPDGCFFFAFNNYQGKQRKMLKTFILTAIRIRLKSNFVMWTVCVLWQWKPLRVETEVGVCFVVTGACQNIQGNSSVVPICHRGSVRLIFWRLGKYLLLIKI